MEVKICGYTVLIDPEDLHIIKLHIWSPILKDNGIVYFQTWHNKKHTFLHKLIYNAEEQQVDHRNRDSLDCRKENLRNATAQQQSANRDKFYRLNGATSKFKGVTKEQNKWRARIRIKNKLIHLGCFNNETDAAKAYDKAAVLYFGEFARPNFS